MHIDGPKGDRMVYAVNLGDLMSYREGITPVWLLLQPVLTDHIRQCEGNRRVDGTGALLDVDAERWAAIYQILRQGCGQIKPIPKYQLRLYESKTGEGGWKRI